MIFVLYKPDLSSLYHHQEDHQTKETSFSSAQFDCSQFCDYQAANTSTEKDLCRQKHADSIQNFSLCPSQSSPQSSKTHDSSIALAHTSVTVDQEHCDAGTVEKGKAKRCYFVLFFKCECNTEWNQLSIDHNASWIPPFRIPQEEHKNVSVERDIWNTVN